MFSIDDSYTDASYINTQELKWITYAFINYFKPKYNYLGIEKPYPISGYSDSKHEVEISKWLNKNNIKFQREYSFPDLKDKEPLRFDFKICDKDILIEYQGSQHYVPSPAFGGKTGFETIVKHDNMKRLYCAAHGYTLIEIPYKYKNLEMYLNQLID